MTIGVHAQPSTSTLGGTDVVTAVLAEALSDAHDVEIIRHGAGVTIESLGRFSGTRLERVRLRTVPALPSDAGRSYNPIRRYRQTRDWGHDLSAPYDLFITFTHEPPPFCHAPRGVLVVLFPMFVPFHRAMPLTGTRSLWDRARGVYSSVEWKKRLATYDVTVAISEFVRTWVDRLWGVDAEVVYPPGEDSAPGLDKIPLVLSVGRFTSGGNMKCQLDMVHAFKALALPGWSYASVGAIGPSPEDQAYAGAVRRAAAGLPISIEANLDRAAVRDLYGRAKIFWHAAGFGSSEAAPEQSEHFGISTVEAMAAGCVPVVMNMGAQPEIVEHGVSGFLWQSLDELCRYTNEIATDTGLWSRMSRAARKRAEQFDRRHYVERFLQVLRPAL
jgi:glycosyltransferase involved in cell wall biosynthesis